MKYKKHLCEQSFPYSVHATIHQTKFDKKALVLLDINIKEIDINKERKYTDVAFWYFFEERYYEWIGIGCTFPLTYMFLKN
ncbi:hypothetical protein KDH_17890 [Dictyobacter sp. S3.2.2.5]|uniref:Uncharacterized protein n=1 Tax=Dictyobacter halimunensis TaxID=3026934 RepID=A0ABQ6FMM3_9CHLR|nr:hypothetical protein KDH_17890 [Dictyobacter sp. S3.2.2.5]